MHSQNFPLAITVIGPTCSLAPVTAAAQCFQEETVKLCNKLNGIHFGNRFCLLEGTDWTFIGPTVYQRTETIGQTNDFCRELKQGLSGYFNFMESHEITGRFCLVKERVPTTTPFCNDYGCNTTMGQQFCNRFGGKDLASGFMCSLCDSFRQVVGPLTWNGNLLEGNPDYCEGHFCAIPNRGAYHSARAILCLQSTHFSFCLLPVKHHNHPTNRTTLNSKRHQRQSTMSLVGSYCDSLCLVWRCQGCGHWFDRRRAWSRKCH